MSEETKEILYLQNYIGKYKSDEKAIIKGNRLTTPAMLDYLEVKKLLDYINNLQQKVKQLENIRKEAIEECKSVIGNPEHTIVSKNELMKIMLNILNKGSE